MTVLKYSYKLSNTLYISFNNPSSRVSANLPITLTTLAQLFRFHSLCIAQLLSHALTVSFCNIILLCPLLGGVVLHTLHSVPVLHIFFPTFAVFFIYSSYQCMMKIKRSSDSSIYMLMTKQLLCLSSRGALLVWNCLHLQSLPMLLVHFKFLQLPLEQALPSLIHSITCSSVLPYLFSPPIMLSEIQWGYGIRGGNNLKH